MGLVLTLGVDVTANQDEITDSETFQLEHRDKLLNISKTLHEGSTALALQIEKWTMGQVDALLKKFIGTIEKHKPRT